MQHIAVLREDQLNSELIQTVTMWHTRSGQVDP